VDSISDSQIIENVINRLHGTFNKKNVEYKGSAVETWRNFTQGAALQSETKEQTLLGYVNKQIVSLFDAKHVNPERLTDKDFVFEKAGDIAVYMIILMAMAQKTEMVGV